MRWAQSADGSYTAHNHDISFEVSPEAEGWVVRVWHGRFDRPVGTVQPIVQPTLDDAKEFCSVVSRRLP